jgi:SAM-dependent methyltransferase
MSSLKSKFKTAEFLLTTGFYAIETQIGNLGIHENRKECNVCGWQGKQFYAFFNEMCRQKDQTLCPRCWSSVYQRNLAKYILENLDSDYPYKVLECSPHASDPVGVVLKHMDYISIDIVKGRAMIEMDLTDLKFRKESFDIVVCSAVLEHVDDDVKALQEMYRVVKIGGRAIVQIPMGYHGDMKGEHTTEFEGMPFYEHHRAYGYNDFINKMNYVGFRVERHDYHDDRLGLESPSLMGLFVGRKE